MLQNLLQYSPEFPMFLTDQESLNTVNVWDAAANNFTESNNPSGSLGEIHVCTDVT